MAEVHEIRLPGIGARFEFGTRAGNRLGVIAHRSGRREVVVYDRDDPDRCTKLLDLTPEESRTLVELLGGSQVVTSVGEVQQRVEGLILDWTPVPEGSPVAGRSIGDLQVRTRTGASIVAVLHGDRTVPSPDPSYTITAGDTLVTVATDEGTAAVQALLEGTDTAR
jgi:TrkA domain protein